MCGVCMPMLRGDKGMRVWFSPDTRGSPDVDKISSVIEVPGDSSSSQNANFKISDNMLYFPNIKDHTVLLNQERNRSLRRGRKGR